MILELQDGKSRTAQDERQTGIKPISISNAGHTRQWPLVLALLFVASLASLPSSALGASTVTLEWDANTETNLAGYNLKYGRSSGQYSSVSNVGRSTVATVPNLGEGWYFFVVTAYDTSSEGSLSKPTVS